MPIMSGVQQLSSVNVYSSEVNRSTKPGALAVSDDGRKYRYVKAGASALVVGNAIQTPAEDAQFKDMAVVTGAAGANVITVTLGSTATTAGLLNGAVIVVSVTPGLGQQFTITSHDVASGAASCNFYTLEPITTALSTSSKVTIYFNPYVGVIQSPTTSSGKIVGGAGFAIPASNYGWVQCGGLGTALSDATATTAALQSLTASVSTAGCVTKQVSLAQVVGSAYTTVTISAKCEPIFWLID